MKILVFSDSHGHTEQMIEAVEREHPDHIFFLGDCYRDSRELASVYPRIPINAVGGNCDGGAGPGDLIVELEGVRFLLTHGHLHGAKSGLGGLIRAGLQNKVDMVCFGHTHEALNIPAAEGLWLFNPGTVGGIHYHAGYGVLTVDGGTVNGSLLRA